MFKMTSRAINLRRAAQLVLRSKESLSSSGRPLLCQISRCDVLIKSQRCFSTEELPESVGRFSEPSIFPNEYPGMNYDFNWCLNGDGVTPTQRCAFRITKPLDLKVAGLPIPQARKVAEKGTLLEAGTDELPFGTFDATTQKVKDALSYSKKLLCPEGYAPGTRTGVRVITNCPNITPPLVAYLERMGGSDPVSQPITCYVLQTEGSTTDFAGYAIEIVEDEEDEGKSHSAASVVIESANPTVELVAAGIKLSAEGIAADESAGEESA